MVLVKKELYVLFSFLSFFLFFFSCPPLGTEALFSYSVSCLLATDTRLHSVRSQKKKERSRRMGGGLGERERDRQKKSTGNQYSPL